MTRSKSLSSSVAVPPIFVMNLINAAQFSNATSVGKLCPIIVI